MQNIAKTIIIFLVFSTSPAFSEGVRDGKDSRYVVKYEKYKDKPNKLSYVDLFALKGNSINENQSVISAVKKKEKSLNILDVEMKTLFPENPKHIYKDNVFAERVYYILSQDETIEFRNLSTQNAKRRVSKVYIELLREMKEKGYLLYKGASIHVFDDDNDGSSNIFNETFLSFKKMNNHGFYLADSDDFIREFKKSVDSNNYSSNIYGQKFFNERNFNLVDMESNIMSETGLLQKRNIRSESLIYGHLNLDTLMNKIETEYKTVKHNVVDIEKIYSSYESISYWVAIFNTGISRYKFGVYKTEKDMLLGAQNQLKKGYHPVDISFASNQSLSLSQRATTEFKIKNKL